MKYIYYFETVPGSSIFYAFTLRLNRLIPFNDGKPFFSKEELILSARKTLPVTLAHLSHRVYCEVPQEVGTGSTGTQKSTRTKNST